MVDQAHTHRHTFPPPQHPPPMSAGPKSCPAGLEIFGVRRRPAPWVQLQKPQKIFFVLKMLACLTCLRLGSGPAQPATRACQPSPPSPETGLRPSLPMPATRPAPTTCLETGLRPTTSLTCLVSETGVKLCQLLSLSDVPQQPLTSCSRLAPKPSSRPSPFGAA